jgi:outer membrane DcaP-like protein
MSWKYVSDIVRAFRGAALVLILIGDFAVARADETADPVAGQKRLERRLDEMAQTAPIAPVGTDGPIVAGSFPRSFLIPGTDVSLRIGGQALGSALWYFKGANTGGALGNQGGSSENYTDGQGSVGNLASIPLGGVPASNAVGFAHSRSSTWDFSGKLSRLFLDARTPSPYGEVKAYIEFDFGAINPFTNLNNNRSSVNGYLGRFRQGYAAIGDLLMGQTQGTFTDNDSLPELVDFANETGVSFPARVPQLRYTLPVGYGATIALGIEASASSAAGPFGPYFTDTNQIPTISSCAALTTPAISLATGTTTAGGTPVVTNITNACLGSIAFFNPLQDLMPDFVLRGRLEQPWGHLQVGFATIANTLNDGMFLNQTFIGYGGALSGNFFTWGKDNLTWGTAAGDGIGDLIANNYSVATNFGAALKGQTVTAADSRSFFSTNRALYDSGVRTTTIVSYAARIAYQHWWTPELRSTVDFSMNHQDVPSFGVASIRAANNKELTLTHANLIWSPIAFVDLGVEYAWGHRVTVANAKGNAYTLQSSLRVRF